eukprot:gene5817-11737_t
MKSKDSRKSPISLSSMNTDLHHSRTSSPHMGITTRRRKSTTHVSAFKKKICGDIFGTSMTGDNSMLGMLYRSRIQESLLNASSSQAHDDKLEESSTSDIMSNAVDIIDDSSDSDNDFSEAMNPRQRLALTIRNWSTTEENDEYLLKEGAVHAIVALAGTEDHRIKLYCASALYHISSREANREELLAVGASTGVITIAMSVRHWKIAKLCALTLCNLSFHNGGESTMAKEGAVLALVILLAVRNQRLAPVCVQALYNLTCVDNHFKGMERIIKALLNLPPLSPFDSTPYVVKSLVNCSRFPPLRMRIVEDGALQTFSAFITTINSREHNREDLVLNISRCIRQLSETVGCRVDMISKGLIFEKSVNIVIDLALNSDNPLILQYAASCFYIFTIEKMRGDSKLTIRMLKALPKLLLSSDPLTQFFSVTTSANIFFQELCNDSTQLEGLLRNFVEAGRNVEDSSAVQALVVAVAQLSQQSKYMDIIAHHGLLDQLLDTLLVRVSTDDNNGDIGNDVAGSERKEQRQRTKEGKERGQNNNNNNNGNNTSTGTDKDLENIKIREACCVAICRIALRLNQIDKEKRRQIASVLTSMLTSDQISVLENTVSGIRALAEKGICHTELLCDQLIHNIAQIAIRYKNEISLCRLCCAALAVFSYDKQAHESLSSEKVMNVIFTITKSDDIATREFVATCICNISINPDSSRYMIQKGVVEVISSLSGATSERIQELSAKCICNLTCISDCHNIMIKHKVLPTILMISLVRSVSITTRRLCARSLLNMLNEINTKMMLDAGVIRAFANLSLINCVHTQFICARAFLIFTYTEKAREEICNRRSVLHSLLGLVKCDSNKTKGIVGKAVCNILACPVTRKAAIIGGALSVLKIIATFKVEELRERTAMVLIVMAKTPSLYDFLLREPIIPVLVLILQESGPLAFECAIFALSSLSANAVFRELLINKGCVSAIVTTVRVAEEICRCFCYISFLHSEAETIVSNGNMLLGLHAIHRSGICSKGAAEMIAIILRNLTSSSHVCPLVVEQDGVKLLRALMSEFNDQSPIMCKAVVIVLHNLGCERHLHHAIIEQGMLPMLLEVASHVNDILQQHQQQLSVVELNKKNESDAITRQRKSISISAGVTTSSSPLSSSLSSGAIAGIMKLPKSSHSKPYLSHTTMLMIISAIEQISESVSCRIQIVNGKAATIFGLLMDFLNDDAKYRMACSIANLASTKECRDQLVEQNAVELLISLANSQIVQTRTQCSVALGFLSEYTKVQRNTVASLLLLSLKTEEMGNGRTHLTLFEQNNSNDMNDDSIMPSREYGINGTKSVSAMIKEGLMRHKNEHNITVEDISNSNLYRNNNNNNNNRNKNNTNSNTLALSSSFDALSEEGDDMDDDLISTSVLSTSQLSLTQQQAQAQGQTVSSVSASVSSVVSATRRMSLNSNNQQQPPLFIADSISHSSLVPLATTTTIGDNITTNNTSNTTMNITANPNPTRSTRNSIILIPLQTNNTDDDHSLDEFSVATLATTSTATATTTHGGILQSGDNVEVYPEHVYHMVQHEANVEGGGMAKKLVIELPYPALSSGIYTEPPDRMKEVLDVPVISEKIPKDMILHDLSKVTQMNSAMSEKSESYFSDTEPDSPSKKSNTRYGRNSIHIRKRSESNLLGVGGVGGSNPLKAKANVARLAGIVKQSSTRVFSNSSGNDDFKTSTSSSAVV